MDFCGHQSFIAIAEAHENNLARAQFRQPEAAERFHMDKNVLRAFPACEKAEALGAIEPFYDGTFQPTGRRYLHMSSDGW